MLVNGAEPMVKGAIRVTYPFVNHPIAIKHKTKANLSNRPEQYAKNLPFEYGRDLFRGVHGDMTPELLWTRILAAWISKSRR
jgi:hypothetical protein